MPTTATALCITALRTHGDLWHSTDEEDRKHAKRICRRCPLLDTCANAGLNEPTARGIWGALDTNDRRRAHAKTHAKPQPTPGNNTHRPRGTRPNCGTEDGYRSHRNRHEDCPRCENAHAHHIEAQRRTNLAEQHQLPEGGSSAGYQLHRKLGELPCDACRTASSAADRERKQSNPKRPRAAA